MTILVTGGLGVIGSCVTRRLIDLGHRPVVLDSRPDFSLLPSGMKDKFDFLHGDLANADFLASVYSRHAIRRTIHLATMIVGAEEQPLSASNTNITGTINLMEAARRHDAKRFVFASSRAVYGPITGRHAHPEYVPIPEDLPLRGVQIYDTCKIACEGFGRHYAVRFGLEFIALRFSTTFGPGKTARYGSPGVLGSIIEAPYFGKPVRIASGGDQRDDMIYIEDAARALILVALHPRPSYTEYNICSGTGYRLRDVANAVRGEVPHADIEIGSGVNYMGVVSASGVELNYSGIMDATRAREDLAFTVEFGLKEAVSHYYHRLAELEPKPLA